jgi:hypothetical protein
MSMNRSRAHDPIPPGVSPPGSLIETGDTEWNCPCPSCAGGDPDTWRWKGEYTVGADGTRTIWIVDAEDEERCYHIDLPPGIVLAQVQPGVAGAGPQ